MYVLIFWDFFSVPTAFAFVGRYLCTVNVHPVALSAGRLIPLDKYPGVRSIGVGKLPGRIITKAVLDIDITTVTGSLQVYTGLDDGCEAAVHAIRDFLDNPETEAVILVEATNTFNVVNHQAALHRIQVLYHTLYQILLDTYQSEIQMILFQRYLPLMGLHRERL